ncbi:MAG: hypothetical protein MJZ66_01465 [Bacteroidales bacterium]|nr:hypothetical protein [Bacteroidales bacterium]
MLTSIISEQRLSNIQAAAYEIKTRLRDFLRSGLFRMASNIDESTGQLRRRLIDNQAPGLASMLASLSQIPMDSPFWKQQFLASVSRIYMLASAISNIESLAPEWQVEVLMLSGVSYPQAEVLKTQPVADSWMCLAATKSAFNSMTMIRTWFVGNRCRKFACNVEYVAGTHHITTTLSNGSCYQSSFYYYPGIHSMRVLYSKIDRMYQPFVPQAYSGIDVAISICRRAFADNPFMLDIPLIISGLRISKTDDGRLLLADRGLNVFPLMLGYSNSAMLLACTGGQEFSAFVVFHEFYCEVVSFWADGKYYVLINE